MSQFGYESFKAITRTGTDNETQSKREQKKQKANHKTNTLPFGKKKKHEKRIKPKT